MTKDTKTEAWEEYVDKYISENVEDTRFNQPWLRGHLKKLLPELLTQERAVVKQEGRDEAVAYIKANGLHPYFLGSDVMNKGAIEVNMSTLEAARTGTSSKEDTQGGLCSKCGAWKGGAYGMNGDGVQSVHVCKEV